MDFPQGLSPSQLRHRPTHPWKRFQYAAPFSGSLSYSSAPALEQPSRSSRGVDSPRYPTLPGKISQPPLPHPAPWHPGSDSSPTQQAYSSTRLHVSETIQITWSPHKAVLSLPWDTEGYYHPLASPSSSLPWVPPLLLVSRNHHHF